jgi:hypothetical protein
MSFRSPVSEDLSSDLLHEIFYYDPNTGELHWKIYPSSKVHPGDKAGTLERSGYYVVCFHGKRYKAHRLVWLYIYGEWPKKDIDHINGDKTDNKISNLRDVSHRVNSVNNKKRRKGGLSGIRLAPKSNNSWEARILIKGKLIRLGNYPTAELAHARYMEEFNRLEHQ